MAMKAHCDLCDKTPAYGQNTLEIGPLMQIYPGEKEIRFQIRTYKTKDGASIKVYLCDSCFLRMVQKTIQQRLNEVDDRLRPALPPDRPFDPDPPVEEGEL